MKKLFRTGLIPGSILFLSLSFSHAWASSPETLVLTLPTDPKSFNAMVAKETSTTVITGFIFEGLTRFNPLTGEVEPALAEHWDTSPDGLTWTFHLRPGTVWSDGIPFTARDVLFTFQQLIYNPKILASARDIFILDGKPIAVEVLDERTVRFQLPVPFAPFLMAMEQPIFPEHILRDAVQNDRFSSAWGIGEAPEKIVGTGPFQLKRYANGERVELVKNERYWRRDSSAFRLPYLEKIIFLIIPSPDGRLLKFLEGETDSYALSGKDYPVLAPLKEKKKFRLYETGPSLNSFFLAFNQNSKSDAMRSWFSSKDFRQAAAYALDRASMIDIIDNRLGVAQCGPLSPSVPFFYNADVPCYDYDVQKSKKLLAGLGLRDQNGDGFLEDAQGRPVEFTIMTNAESPERVQMAGMIRGDLARIGLKVNLLTLEFNSIVSKLTVTGDWDAILLGLTASVDPHFGANVWLSSGNLHFWNYGPNRVVTDYEKRIDEIFNLGLRTMDRNARKKLYDEWQMIAAREVPLVYTELPKVVYAIRDRFENLKPSAIGGPFHNIEEIRVKEK